ncbi:uncharacterized protein LOC111359312 isoform X2 [Spodoptera litura]|uniref:Uncharacterized protein LOC111359312 isoform X2 n=1 Tax=Spodoptera litura TaxID=69820 RepID=A0A9J7ELL1_SPOLT|nr:uncharacterized protein LOC111359312 isoform X2 [Spodoptera litura]
MAPKHWEEGPPRYLGSTEYERPPPYYYPGPKDRAQSLPGRGWSWAEYLAESPGARRRTSLRDADVDAAQERPRRPPGFSWAEYLRTSPSTLQSTVGESSKEESSSEQGSSKEPPRKWAEYLRVVGPSPPRQVDDEVKPDAASGPPRAPGGSSWAQYLAASRSPPRLDRIELGSEQPRGRSWAQYLQASDRQ